MTTAIGAYATTTLTKERLLAAGVTDTADDTLIARLVDQANQYIETTVERVLAPVSSATYTLDGNGKSRLYFPRGIRAISLLEIAEYTGGSYTTETSTNYLLRPSATDRTPGFPAEWLCLSDRSTQHLVFPVGYDTVRMTATTGWAAIPDDVIDVALTIVVRMWHARQSGQADIVGTDDTGAPLVSRFVSSRDRATLHRYRIAWAQ